MNKVYAGIDTQGNTDAVIDWAVWSAQRLDAPLEFLHVLDRHPERAQVDDYSGAIGLGAQEALLSELSSQDEALSKRAREAGRLLLVHARARAAEAGKVRLDARLRHGELIDTLLELEDNASLFVLGEHYHATQGKKIHMDHHVERVIRHVSRPVLVATSETFQAPLRAVIAFDGSANARKAVDAVVRSPLLTGLPILLAMAGLQTSRASRQLEEARQALAAAGLAVDVEVVSGVPEQVLPPLVKAQGAALLVMGAYGRSRLHALVMGSTTTTLLRLSSVPVLVLR